MGESFRVLRKERGYTLKSLSEGIVSFSYLSKYEQGKSDITLSTLILLLKRLNISVDEFLYFNNIRTTTYNDTSTLRTYLLKETKLYAQTNIINHKCNAVAISALLSDIDPTHIVPDENRDFLADYLISCSYWSTYEISLFGNSLQLFSKNYLLNLINEIEKRAYEYKITKRNLRDLIALLLNACFVLLRQQYVPETKLILNKLAVFIEPDYYLEKSRMFFIEGLILILEGNEIDGIQRAEESIHYIKYIDDRYYEDFKKELTLIINMKK